MDYDAGVPTRPQPETIVNQSVESSSSTVVSGPNPGSTNETYTVTDTNKGPESRERDDVFSDSEAEDSVSSKSKQAGSAPENRKSVDAKAVGPGHSDSLDQAAHVTHQTEHLSLGSTGSAVSEARKDVEKGTVSGLEGSNSSVGEVSEFKVMAADASVFTFGDEEDYESE